MVDEWSMEAKVDDMDGCRGDSEEDEGPVRGRGDAAESACAAAAAATA